MSADLQFGLLVVAMLILLFGAIYFLYRYEFPSYGNQLLDTLQLYQSWQYLQPANNPNNSPDIPYVFKILSSVGSSPIQVQLSYYDDVGYFKGFSTYLLNCTIVSNTEVQFTLVKTLVNYSQIPPVFPWTLTYIDATHLQFSTPKFSRILQRI
jgi:hypothetical protein